MKINMFDPTRDYNNHKQEYDNEITSIIQSGKFINGPQIKELELILSKYIGTKYCITCGNGTDALQIALMALGIKPGDEIITTPHTWISTSEVISLLGAKPVYVDIDEKTFNIDYNKINITNRTKAIIPVSLYGMMYDQRINTFGIPVIEDGAQSFGASVNGNKSCSVSAIGCTSFFPSKPLGCFGDGGAMFTNDDELAIKLRSIKSHGCLKRFYHDYIGVNSRLNTIQAGVLKVKMKYFDDSIKKRNEIAKKYNEEFKDLNLKTPIVLENHTHVWAQYSLLVNPNIRDRIVNELKQKDINVAIYYPKPLHTQKCFSNLNYQEGDFPVSEEVCKSIINLPCYAELTNEEIDYVIKSFKEIYSYYINE